ncbi:hypothetical protein E2986_11428 [Frieseomelitta varia]|uniref:Uncharacterized protein n=1 Tax=Frieseomelitta varia TaxID=561572 RepID=A0A833RIP7_9HYME|nr:hypothetical protein E2986_11428 [Frieseomelitta varia]
MKFQLLTHDFFFKNHVRSLIIAVYGWQKFYPYFWVSAKETELIQQSELDCFMNKTFFVFYVSFNLKTENTSNFSKLLKQNGKKIETIGESSVSDT